MSLISNKSNTIISTNPSITEYDLKLFESKLKATLPQYYREFLLKYNGGRLEHSNFNVFEKCYPTPYPDGFISIKTINRFSTLDEVNEEFKYNDSTVEMLREMVDAVSELKDIIVPEDVIVIGDAEFSLLLAFRGQFVGNIYQYHHEGLFLVAKNIDELIAKCYTIDYDLFEEINSQIKKVVNDGDLETFKDLIMNKDGYELLSNFSMSLREITRRLLRPQTFNGEQIIENYEDFLNVLEEKKLITWDSLTKWAGQYDHIYSAGS